MKPHILVVDPHPTMLRGITTTLGDHWPEARFAECTRLGEAEQKAARHRPDLIVLEHALPDSQGVEAIITLNRRSTAPILVFSGLDESRHAIPALGAGAKGFVSKHREKEVLRQAARKLLDGQRFVSEELSQRMLQAIVDGKPGHRPLSAQEHRVLLLLGDGLSVSEVGERMGLSAKTVSTYKYRIMEKLNLARQTDLIRFCLSNGLID